MFIYELRTGLQFLRCFGDLISEMAIVFYGNEISTYLRNVNRLTQSQIHNINHSIKSSKREHLIIEYINEYCFQYLIKFKVLNNPKCGLNKLTKIFNKVEEIILHDSYPTETKLNKIFPD